MIKRVIFLVLLFFASQIVYAQVDAFLKSLEGNWQGVGIRKDLSSGQQEVVKEDTQSVVTLQNNNGIATQVLRSTNHLQIAGQSYLIDYWMRFNSAQQQYQIGNWGSSTVSSIGTLDASSQFNTTQDQSLRQAHMQLRTQLQMDPDLNQSHYTEQIFVNSLQQSQMKIDFIRTE